MPESITYIGIYLAGITLLAIVMTLYDKRAARLGSWRVKERTLLLNWANIWTGSEMEVKKMIIAHLIKRITVSVGNSVDIDFNISLRQFLNYQQTAKKAHSINCEPSFAMVETIGIEPTTS